MASVFQEARIRIGIRTTATIVIETQRVGAREQRRNTVIDQKRERSAETRHLQAIFTRRIERGEISFQNGLVSGIVETNVLAAVQRATEHFRASIGIDDVVGSAGTNLQFAEITE